MRPRLIFFCELDTPELIRLFENDSVLPLLKELGAGISLGILDFSEERANLVRILNQAGIPVIAWLLLPKEDGYWSNIHNARETLIRYEAFKDWTVKYKLSWFSVGFDVEPDLRMVEKGLQNFWSLIPQGVINVFRFNLFNQSKRIYKNLISTVKSDGFIVETYQYPLIVDERLVRTSLFQRFAGVIDLKSDREVLMLYTSFVSSSGSGLIWSYGKDAKYIGIGSTGGGIQLGRQNSSLDWSEIERDLRTAWRWANDIYIFSLEGCVQQNLLKKFVSFEWDKIILEPVHQTTRIDRWRISFQFILGLITYIPLFFAVSLILSVLIYNFSRKR